MQDDLNIQTHRRHYADHGESPAEFFNYKYHPFADTYRLKIPYLGEQDNRFYKTALSLISTGVNLYFKSAKSECLTIKYRHGLNLVPNLWSELLQQHIKIYQALLTRDKKRTTQIIEQHAGYEKSKLMDVMEKVRSDAFLMDEF